MIGASSGTDRHLQEVSPAVAGKGVVIYRLKPKAEGAAEIKGLIGSASPHGKIFVLDRR